MASTQRKEQIKAHLAITTDLKLEETIEPVDPRKQRIKEHISRTRG